MNQFKSKTLILILIATVMLVIPILAMAIEPPAPVAKTGQTTCYDVAGNVISCSGTGQDGDLQKGVACPSPRFTDNSDGTVTDNLTGLMWAKDARIQENFGSLQWGDALDHANNLSLGSNGCGASYTDWRLPNVKELQSLLDYSNVDPAMPSGHPFIGAYGEYWSSTHIWSVSLNGGLKNNINHADYRYVWKVRGETAGSLAPVAKTGQTTRYGTGDDGDLQEGIASPSPRFTDNGDGTVTDNLTGLMWAKDANLSGSKNWEDALDHANNLSLGSDGCGTSYTDWRLPNIKELQSLIDFGNEAPALSSSHLFINVGGEYWSSTTLESLKSWSWFMITETGKVFVTSKGTGFYVWPVRGGN